MAFKKARFGNDNWLELSWYNEGLAYLQLGNYDEALRAFNNAVEINPRYQEAWNGKDMALKSLGRTAEASAAFAKANELGYKG